MKLLSLTLLSFLLLTGCQKSLTERTQLAQDALLQKKYIDAVDHITAGLSNQSKNESPFVVGNAYEILGQAYQGIHKPDEARRAYQEAIKLSTNTYQAALNLGYIEIASQATLPAQEAFKQALNSRPNDPAALLGLGDAYYLAEQWAEAERAYNQLLDISPGVRESLKNLSLLNQKKKTPKPIVKKLKIYHTPLHQMSLKKDPKKKPKHKKR